MSPPSLAHAEERDLIPPPAEITADELDGLGNRMLEQMDEVRTSLTNSFAFRPEALCC